jgi:undecaprenyl-diphosphatase
MSVLSAMLLGLIQGIAEFLPISSSGHLSIFQNFFNLTPAEDGHMFFDVLLHLGTLISVCVVYRKDISAIIRDTLSCIRSIGHPQPGGPKHYPGARLLLMMFIATLPLFIILPINGVIEKLYYNTLFIGLALIVTGFVLFFSDKMKNGKRNEKTMSVGSAVIIGIAQAIATAPGISRSGMTISAGMATGLDREFAAKFSFLISIPAILGANLLSLFKAISGGVDTSLIPTYLLGMLVAMVSGYFAVSLVKLICKKGKFGCFSYYCWAAGAVTVICSIIL